MSGPVLSTPNSCSATPSPAPSHLGSGKRCGLRTRAQTGAGLRAAAISHHDEQRQRRF